MPRERAVRPLEIVVARPGDPVIAAGKGHVSGDLLGMADDG